MNNWLDDSSVFLFPRVYLVVIIIFQFGTYYTRLLKKIQEEFHCFLFVVRCSLVEKGMLLWPEAGMRFNIFYAGFSRSKYVKSELEAATAGDRKRFYRLSAFFRVGSVKKSLAEGG